MCHLYYTIINSPIGKLLIATAAENILSGIFFLKKETEHNIKKNICAKYKLINVENNNIITHKVVTELNLYFTGELTTFSITPQITGTIYQKKVWNALLEIPYGKTSSYSAIAQQIGHPKSYRAVGQANHINPIPIVIPCHRVIGKNNELTGYAGGINIKKWLLLHETTNKIPF